MKNLLENQPDENWKEIPYERFNGKILTVSVLADGSGYAVIKGGDLAFTNNDGTSWTIVPIEGLKKLYKSSEFIACDLNFENEKTGEMAVSILCASLTIIVHLKTEDGGQT